MTWESLVLELIEASIFRPVVLVFVVGVSLHLFRIHHPASKHAVWTAALIGILLLPIVSVWIPHLNFPVLPEWRVAGHAEQRTANSSSFAGAETISSTAQTQAVDEIRQPSPEINKTYRSVPAPSVRKTIDFGMLVIWVYLAGLLVMVMYRLMGSILLRRVLLRSSSLSRGLLRESGDVVVPVTAGMIRPVVLLPAGWRKWDFRLRRAVLAHEFEHIRRRDTWISGFGRAVTSLLWFHPLAWWLFRKISELSEMACDIAAVKAAGDRAAYAQTLLDFAACIHRAGYRSTLPGLAIAGTSGLGKRMDMVLASSGVPIRRWGRTAVILGLIAAPVFCIAATFGATGMPQQLRIEASFPPPPPPPPALLSSPISPAPLPVAAGGQNESEIPKDMGRATGTLFTADGRPAPNTEVVAMLGPEDRNGAQIWTVVRRSRTDSDGRFRMDLPPGSYFIAYWVGRTTYYPGVTNSDRAAHVVVTVGQAAGGLDFRVDPSSGVRVRGRLVPAPGAASSLLQVGLGSPVEDFADPFNYATYSGAIGLFPVKPDGSFEFPVVPPMEYALRVFSVARTNPQPIAIPGQPVIPFPRMSEQPPGYNLVIPQIDVSGVEVPVPLFVAAHVGLESGGRLPIFGADSSVKIRTDGIFDGSVASVSPAGAALLVLPVGQHRISFELPFGYYMKSFSYGNTDLLRAPLNVTGPAASDIIGTVTTTPPAYAANFVTVRGRVTGLPNSTSNTYARSPLMAVLVASGSGAFGFSPLGDGGTFEIRGVPPGTYMGYATLSGGTYEYGKSIVVASSNLDGVELPVDPNVIHDKR